MFKTLDDVLAQRTPEDLARVIADGDKLAAKRNRAVKYAAGDTDPDKPISLHTTPIA